MSFQHDQSRDRRVHPIQVSKGMASQPARSDKQLENRSWRIQYVIATYPTTEALSLSCTLESIDTTIYFFPLEASSSAFCFVLFSLFPRRRASLRALRNRTYWLSSFSDSSILRSVTAGAGVGKGIGISLLSWTLERSGFYHQRHSIESRYVNGHFLLTLLATSLAREDNQFSLVCIQPCNIDFQTLLVGVASPVVYCNTQFSCLVDFKASLLEFFKGESSAFTDFDVVSETRATDSGSKESGRTGSKGSGTLCTSETTTLFTSRLVEPCSDSTLPILRS